MEFNKDKVDSMTLALLYLVTTKDKYGYRAWKGFDWDTMDRLYEKGYISNPKGKAKSVALTEEGEKLSARLFKEYFEVPTS
jgi:DNA-binding PadR family transcriptional regulator